MNKTELIDEGRQLAGQLEKLAVTVHPKSDEHTGLLWEAGILRAKSKDVESQCGVKAPFKSSVLLRYCDPLFLSAMPEIVNRVHAFHAAYENYSQD